MTETTSISVAQPFVWHQLCVPDNDAARSFYCQALGWEAVNFPDTSGVSKAVSVNGAMVACTRSSFDDAETYGLWPQWLVTCAVDDFDATLRRCLDLGATMRGGVVDMLEYGRFVLIQDPNGVHFRIAEGVRELPKEFGETFAWHQLVLPNREADREFYCEVFGWKKDEGDTKALIADGVHVSCTANAAEHGIEPQWTVYLGVDDLQVRFENCVQLGAEILIAPHDNRFGQFAMLRDPQGAIFWLFRPVN